MGMNMSLARILAVIGLVLIPLAPPMVEPVAAADYQVHFERVRESPVSITFEVDIIGLEAPKYVSVRLDDLDIPVELIDSIDVVEVKREAVYSEKVSYKEVALTQKEIDLQKIEDGGELPTTKQVVDKYTYSLDYREKEVKIGEVDSTLGWVSLAPNVAKPAKSLEAVVVSSEKLAPPPIEVPWPESKSVYRFTVNTGVNVRDDGYGSKGLLVLTIDGKDYYDNTNSSWWDSAWGYRNILAFNATGIGEDLYWFPTLVVFKTGNHFDFDKVAADGADIRFVDKDDATELPYEIEQWDDTNETAYVWVRVPKVDANSTYSDYFYVYYGNDLVADAQDAEHVWAPPDSTLADGTGAAVGAPVTFVGAGTHSVNVTTNGTFTVTLPTATTGTAKSGTANVTDSPKALVAGENTITVETTGLISIDIHGYVAVYHMNDDPTNSTQILDSTANGNTGTKGGAYASNAADLSNGTGTLASNPTEIAAGTSGTEVVVTSAGTFTITIPANQLLIVTKGTVTSVAINNPTAGNRTITVVGTGTFTATWAVTAAPTEVAGTIGRAQQFVAESQQYIQLATSPLAGCTQATVMAVVRKDSWVKFQSAAASYTAGNKGWILGYENPSGTIQAYVGDGTATAIAEQTGFPSAEWASMAFRYVASDASGITAFVNGSGGTPIDTTTVAQLDPTPPAAYIGRYYIRYSNYTIDECRLSSVARSAEWIEAEYLSMWDDLLYYGNEDPPPTLSTLAATGVYMNGGTHATLRGNLTSIGGAPTANVWFEWGYTTAYGNYAGNVTANATGTYTATITGYDPSNTVYYRFVGENVDGTTYGSVVSFTVTPISGYSFLRLIPLLFLVGTVLIIWRNRNPWEIAMLAILGIIMAIVLHSIVIGYW